MAWAALLAQAGMSVVQGWQQSQALKMQGIVAGQQALADEETKRRENAQLRGHNAAALAESGLSADGSSGMMADQSAAMAELDALNIRYKGTLRKSTLGYESKVAQSQGELLAGGKLLSEGSDQYTASRMRASRVH